MTKQAPRTRKLLTKYMFAIAAEMGLCNWEIRSEFPDSVNDGMAARCHADPIYRVATIQFDPICLDPNRINDKYLTRVMVHECIHIIFADVDHWARGMIAEAKDGEEDAKHEYEHMYCKLEENAIRTLEIAFGRVMNDYGEWYASR